MFWTIVYTYYLLVQLDVFPKGIFHGIFLVGFLRRQMP